MQFFRISLPVDPSRILFNFEKTLKKNHIEAPPKALDALFANLKAMGLSDGEGFDSPFPLVRSVAVAQNHSKRMKAALGGKAGLRLGKCQQILSDFYGFGKWDFFKAALVEFSKTQTGMETQCAPEVQSPTITELNQKTVPSQLPLPAVEAEATVRTRDFQDADFLAAEQEADRQWAQEEADRLAAEQETSYAWADQDLGEDDFFDSPRDWVDDLAPEIQDFASQFESEEEFDEYMESRF